MASEWQKLALGDLTEWSSGGTPPKINPEFWGGDITWISASSMKTGRLSESDRTLTPEGLKRGSRLAREGNVLLLVRGSELHKRIPVGIAVREVSFNQDVKALQAKSGLDKDFLYYWLVGNEKMLLSIVENTGIGAGKLDTNILKNLSILLPSLPEQRRIAHILGTLDDKIENNRKTAKTLEAMAQAIFQSWFVDFDPVRAKMAGESKESICKRLKLTPEILDLFPDRLVDSELGEIPDGWSYSRLGDVADVNWGNTRVTKKFYVNQGYLAYSATGPDGFLPYYEHDHVGVVVSAIGANSGYTWLALGKWSTIKNTIRFWSDSADMNTEYLYLATHNINFWPLRGSAQPFISQTDARNTKILHPSKNLAKFFGESASKLFQVVHQKERKSQYLIHLRDTLLPKLISGEIRVPDAQAVVDTTASTSKPFHD